MELGSSPRVRGTLEAARQELARIRFIPACAGNVLVEHGLISFALHDVKQPLTISVRSLPGSPSKIEGLSSLLPIAEVPGPKAAPLFEAYRLAHPRAD